MKTMVLIVLALLSAVYAFARGYHSCSIKDIVTHKVNYKHFKTHGLLVNRVSNDFMWTLTLCESKKQQYCINVTYDKHTPRIIPDVGSWVEVLADAN
jgi:hypothetical protein